MLFDPPLIMFLKHSLICTATTKGRQMTDDQAQESDAGVIICLSVWVVFFSSSSSSSKHNVKLLCPYLNVALFWDWKPKLFKGS